MANSLPRTPMALHMLERALCENHGDLLEACRSIGVSYREACLWQQSDPEAAEAIHQAQLLGWATLENAAYQRAVRGVEKGVYYKGEKVDTETQYSDGLLSQLLKARVPGYKEDDAPGRGGMTVNVAIMPRAENYSDWVAQREQMLAPTRVVEHHEPSDEAKAAYRLMAPAAHGHRPTYNSMPDVL